MREDVGLSGRTSAAAGRRVTADRRTVSASPSDLNRQVVLDSVEAFGSFDPERYEPRLTQNPRYRIGKSVHDGRDGSAWAARMGRTLYPRGQSRRTAHSLIAQGDAVAALATVEAVTNKGEEYENVYALFFEFENGLISGQPEMLDFRYPAATLDVPAVRG